MYEIDSNVTFSPSKRSGRKSKINEMPFDRIGVNESFHVASTDKAQANRLSGYCQIAGKRLNKKFAMRTVSESDPRGPGVRIWRVEGPAEAMAAETVAAEPKATKVVLKSGKRRPEPTEAAPSRRHRRQASAHEFSAHG